MVKLVLLALAAESGSLLTFLRVVSVSSCLCSQSVKSSWWLAGTPGWRWSRLGAELAPSRTTAACPSLTCGCRVCDTHLGCSIASDQASLPCCRLDSSAWEFQLKRLLHPWTCFLRLETERYLLRLSACTLCEHHCLLPSLEFTSSSQLFVLSLSKSSHLSGEWCRLCLAQMDSDTAL